MGFFWEKPPGGKHANPEQTFKKLDELKANKHTLFDVSLFMPKPLWSLANYCMNFLPDSFAYFSQAQRGASQGMVVASRRYPNLSPPWKIAGTDGWCSCAVSG